MARTVEILSSDDDFPDIAGVWAKQKQKAAHSTSAGVSASHLKQVPRLPGRIAESPEKNATSSRTQTVRVRKLGALSGDNSLFRPWDASKANSMASREGAAGTLRKEDASRRKLRERKPECLREKAAGDSDESLQEEETWIEQTCAELSEFFESTDSESGDDSLMKFFSSTTPAKSRPRQAMDGTSKKPTVTKTLSTTKPGDASPSNSPTKKSSCSKPSAGPDSVVRPWSSNHETPTATFKCQGSKSSSMDDITRSLTKLMV
jgi:hypothetical protein